MQVKTISFIVVSEVINIKEKLVDMFDKVIDEVTWDILEINNKKIK